MYDVYCGLASYGSYVSDLVFLHGYAFLLACALSPSSLSQTPGTLQRPLAPIEERRGDGDVGASLLPFLELRLGEHCRPLLRTLPLASTLRCSLFCCCVACACLCLLSHAPVDVAVFWTPLATIKQRAVEQECWGGEGLQRRVWAHGFSEKAGARVAANVLVRDLDLLVPNVHDGRRLEIVAKGLSLFRGVQLVVDTTLVSPLSPVPTLP